MFGIVASGNRYDCGCFQGIGRASKQLVPSSDFVLGNSASESPVRLDRGPRYLLVGGVGSCTFQSLVWLLT